MSNTRVCIIRNHLLSRFVQDKEDRTLENYRKNARKVNSQVIAEEFFGNHYDLIKRLREETRDSLNFDQRKQLFLNKEELHLKVYQQVKEVYAKCKITYEEDLADPIKKTCVLHVLTEYDLAVSTRAIVHLCLYIDTIQNLGTAKHRNLIDRAYKLTDYGCFAMTELGHGSNVAGLETTATYDPKTKQFVFDSPKSTSAKWWIGAASKTANMAVVWAQLVVNQESKGVHVFAIQIRDFETHNVKQGITIGDCGKKNELEGIDNGFIIFKGHRAPYDCLLDKFSQITNDGKYKSAIKNKEKRLGIQLAGLIRGRYGVVSASNINLKNALTTAIRYSVVRKQFNNPGEPEKSILDYQSFRCRLMPHLSKLFAVQSGVLYLGEILTEINSKIIDEPECDELNELHGILSIFNHISTTYGLLGIQECRESSGGHGFSAYSGYKRLKNSVDVMITWEGDNNVLIQQTGKFILKQIQNIFKGAKISAKTLQFLKIDSEIEKWPIKTVKDINSTNIIKIYQSYINFLAKESMKKLQENSLKYSNTMDIWNNSQVNNVFPLS